MKEFSKEIIEIDGVEYTLFVNRKVIVAWEKYSGKLNQELHGLSDKYKNIQIDDNIEITDDTNPFEGLEELDNIDKDHELVTKSFKNLYWLMLYTNHQLSETKAGELYDKACEEYGEENIIALANQMIEDANKDLVTKNQELKNLKALRPKK